MSNDVVYCHNNKIDILWKLCYNILYQKQNPIYCIKGGKCNEDSKRNGVWKADNIQSEFSGRTPQQSGNQTFQYARVWDDTWWGFYNQHEFPESLHRKNFRENPSGERIKHVMGRDASAASIFFLCNLQYKNLKPPIRII